MAGRCIQLKTKKVTYCKRALTKSLISHKVRAPD